MKRKIIRLASGFLFYMTLVASNVFAVTDYSKYSTEELAAMRGTLRNASVEERNAFRTEWQKRMQQMSSDQRQQYVRGRGYGLRDGSCAGTGPGQGMGYGRGGGRR